MNRIINLFQHKKQNILSIYFTAGHPKLDDTVTIIEALEKNGADMIEIGMPFSDPLADGPIIQQSSQIALKNGMSLHLLFNQLENIRNKIKLPLLLMGYINPVIQYGMDNFLKKASEIGIDGIILPDLPLQEYLDEYKDLFDKYNLPMIFLISPQTSDERIRKIDEISNAFIYMVSASSTTGIRGNIAAEQENYFERVKKLNLKNPRVIGFGISSKETFDKACRYANGAIIGTAFIKSLESSTDVVESTARFVKNIRG
ncbi:MAG: tryptophan synthase subunit alpha [Bacteroidales bacterium]|nr:tryptophan synthase subunit alpha [Bacteroidales bacterium]